MGAVVFNRFIRSPFFTSIFQIPSKGKTVPSIVILIFDRRTLNPCCLYKRNELPFPIAFHADDFLDTLQRLRQRLFWKW